MGRHGVSQTMRTKVGGILIETKVGVDDAAHHPRIDPSTTHPQYDGLTGGCSDPLPASCQPSIQGLPCRITQWDRALLVALAKHPHRRTATIQIGKIQPAQLGDSDAAAVKHLEYGGIATTSGGFVVLSSRDGLVHDASSLFGTEHLRQPLGNLGGAHSGRRISLDETMRPGPAEEAARSCPVTLDRRWGFSVVMQTGQPGSHIGDGDARQGVHPAIMNTCHQRGEVASVGTNGVVGSPGKLHVCTEVVHRHAQGGRQVTDIMLVGHRLHCDTSTRIDRAATTNPLSSTHVDHSGTRQFCQHPRPRRIWSNDTRWPDHLARHERWGRSCRHTNRATDRLGRVGRCQLGESDGQPSGGARRARPPPLGDEPRPENRQRVRSWRWATVSLCHRSHRTAPGRGPLRVR